MADRNRFNRPDRYGYDRYPERDNRNSRQQEQFSDDSWGQPEYIEGYAFQMSEPYRRSDYGQRQSDYETGWDSNRRYGQRGTGYSRRYSAEGEYAYGSGRPPAYRFDSFTSEDQGGRDFTQPRSRNQGLPGYGGTGAGEPDYGYGNGSYPASSPARGYGRNRGHQRDWFDRAGDEVMSWFGDEDAARRRRMDHSGRGPANYTRSDERIREDINDNLTDDWGVDASNVTVSVNKGEVVLDGTVATRLQKRRAEDCAEDVSGVTNVQNNLRIEAHNSQNRNERSEVKA